MIQNDIGMIIASIEAASSKLDHNKRLFNILEGDLMTEVKASLDKQLSSQNSKDIAIQRAAPINILKKLKSKLSTIYVDAPKRTTENAINQELINFYEAQGVNDQMHELNCAYNIYKWGGIEIFKGVDERTQQAFVDFRALTSFEFLAIARSSAPNPTIPEYIVRFVEPVFVEVDKGKSKEMEKKNRYWVYSRTEFLSILDDGSIYEPDMVDENGERRINQFGLLPFTYANQSKYQVVPTIDTDTLQMTVLGPVLLTDLNFGSMYSAHPIVYGINVDASNLHKSPEVFWSLSEKEAGQGAASVGVIKAEMNVEAQLKLITEQIGLWLESRDIKAGALGKADQALASGIAKIIDEADTTVNRKTQINAFTVIENDFWWRLANIHNSLVDSGELQGVNKFIEPNLMIVNIEYSSQEPVEDKTAKEARVIAKKTAGIIGRKQSLRELYPTKSEDEINELMTEDVSVIMPEVEDESATV